MDEDDTKGSEGDVLIDDVEEDGGGKQPSIEVIRKHEEFCILRVTRGMGPRAVEQWLHKIPYPDLFAEEKDGNHVQNSKDMNSSSKKEDKKRKREDPQPAKTAVLASPHYSAYARGLVLVARDQFALAKVKEIELTIHCLVKGLRKPPKELVLDNVFDEKKCCIKVRPLANANSNSAGHITLVAATNVAATTSNRHPSGYIHPRQFRRQLKAAALPVLGSAKDCTPFRGESLCMSIVRLQFKTNQDMVQDAVIIPPSPRLRAILDREERFWRAKNPGAPRPISVSLDRDFMGEDPIPRPEAYVSERTTFCGLEFRVTPAVMIPRVGSEAVVNRAITLYENTLPLRSVTDTPMVLDLGTGSGCLLLSILHRMINAFGVGLELSPSALAVAEYNASALGLKTRCNLYEGEFQDTNDISDEPFDIVVCNPPYHTPRGRKLLNASSLAHEPHAALFIEQSDMLKHYRDVMMGLEEADMVKPGTVVVFEVFKDNADAVVKLMKQFKLEEVEIGKDTKGCIRTAEGIYPPASPLLLDESSDDEYY